MGNKSDLLQKIKALAERGMDGEKETAQALLTKLMNKYGITEESLDEDNTTCEWFRYKDDLQKKLLHQIIYMVMGDIDLYRRTDHKFKLTGVYCTVSQKLEIDANYEFFKNALLKELDLFWQAFIHKNHLFPLNGEKVSSDDMPKSELLKLMYMMESMDKHTLLKQITGG